MRKFAPIVAGVALALLAGQAAAALNCTGGTTIIPVTGGTVTMASVNGTNVCVANGDKTFGNFSLGELTADNGSTIVFSIGQGGTAHNIGFDANGTYTEGLTAHFSYEVDLNSTAVPGTQITSWSGDIDETTGNLSTLVKGITPVGPGAGGAINCFAGTGTPPVGFVQCPQTIGALLGTGDTVAEAEFAGTTAQVSAVLDTIFQTIPGVPEPASLTLLGSALIGFGWFARRRHRRV